MCSRQHSPSCDSALGSRCLPHLEMCIHTHLVARKKKGGGGAGPKVPAYLIAETTIYNPIQTDTQDSEGLKMADSPNRHEQPTSQDLYYGCEYLLKPEFWVLGAALTVYTMASLNYITECLKAEEEALVTLPTHETPQPAHLPDNTEEAPDNTEEAPDNTKEETADDTKQEASDETNEEESDPLQPHGQDSPDPTPLTIQSLIALRVNGRLTRRCTRWLVPYLATRWHTALAAAVCLAILGALLLEGYWMEATLYWIVAAMFRQSAVLAHAGSWLRTGMYVLSMVVLALPAAVGAWAGWILVALQIRYVLEIWFCD